jgi:predicted transposase/invertase (TIGR01784 family)
MTKKLESSEDIQTPSPFRRTNDYVFKRIFSDKEVLGDLLSGLLKESVTVVEILNPEIPPESLTDKLSRMDILAKDAKKDLFNVEVQVRYHEGFDDRIAYYGAKAHSDSLKKGDEYTDARRTVMVNILDFLHTKLVDVPRYHTTFMLRSEDASVTLTKKFSIHYVEVPKITDLLNDAMFDNLSKEDKWVLFLNNCGGEVMERIAKEEPMIAKAITIGDIFRRDKAEQERARQREDAIMNWKLTVGPIYQQGREEGLKEGLEEGLKEGLEEGLKEGLKEGRKEGLEEGRKEMARSFLANGVSPELVAKSSGLPLDEVMALMPTSSIS